MKCVIAEIMACSVLLIDICSRYNYEKYCSGMFCNIFYGNSKYK